MAASILYVVTEDWYFLSHRLPMARAAREAGYDVHVATRLNRGKAAIEAEGFTPHALSWRRGSLSPSHSVAGVLELRKLLRSLKPDILHNVSLKPVLLGSVASLGFSSMAVVNGLTGLGTLFVGDHKRSGLARPLVRAALKALLSRSNSRTIVQNPDDKRFVLDLGVPEAHIDLIPGSGVDTAHFVPLPEPGPPVTAAYVGRMLVDKGVETLIEAFALATSRGLKLQLLLAGDTDRENPGLARAGAIARIRLGVRHQLARPRCRYSRRLVASAFRRARVPTRRPAEKPARGGGLRAADDRDRHPRLPRDRD